MEIRFQTGKENHTLNDLIGSQENNVKIVGWSSNDTVTIKDWKFIDYKRQPSKTNESSITKWVHLNQVNFVGCTFKDINFIGGVPMHECTFKNCTFENCMLTDHIRWCKFQNCKFTFCIFAGYFHGTKFSPSCKFDKVLLSCYGDIYSVVRKGAKCTKKEKIELLRYFYPIEAKVYDTFKVGDPYFVKKFTFLQKEMDKLKIHKIGNITYFKDTIKQIDFNLNHYKPSIRIIGKFAPLVKDCKPYHS